MEMRHENTGTTGVLIPFFRIRLTPPDPGSAGTLLCLVEEQKRAQAFFFFLKGKEKERAKDVLFLLPHSLTSWWGEEWVCGKGQRETSSVWHVYVLPHGRTHQEWGREGSPNSASGTYMFLFLKYSFEVCSTKWALCCLAFWVLEYLILSTSVLSSVSCCWKPLSLP